MRVKFGGRGDQRPREMIMWGVVSQTLLRTGECNRLTGGGYIFNRPPCTISVLFIELHKVYRKYAKTNSAEKLNNGK